MNDVKRLNLVDDTETWFYGVHDKDERSEITDPIVSTFSEKQKPKQSLFKDSLGCFVIYKRQIDALLKCEQEGPTARVFAFEYSVHHPGQRRYLVSTVERFWQWYKRQCDVSFYELIPQNRPAHLYFDLEFYRETNLDIKEEELIKDFNDCVSEVFMEMFGINLDPEKEMLVLDASTNTKFSEHIIVHLADNYLFPSNISMKSFIQQLKEKMLSSGRCLVWNAGATKLMTFFDATVYSVNRNFRLYLSSKLGKSNPLVLSQRCNFYAHRKHPSKQQIFLDSLIVPAKYNTPEIFHTLIAENTEYPDIQNRDPKILTISARVPLSNKNVDCIIGQGATSPFPILEQHIIAINRRWKDNASIRQWKLSINKFTMSQHIIYYIANCRYCFNIGREHRSNGIYWIVDLDKLQCFQKCFDADCNGISSNYFPLPNFVCTSLQSTKATTFFDLQLEANKNAIQVPSTEVEDQIVGRNNMSKQLLLDVIREARATNEIEVQKRMLTTRNRSADLDMEELQTDRNSFELTDDELLNAFASVKN
uniref:DNA-directed primase/polymerase protein n=1 Tax=Elaeophora elaphi TaxID=1147741 RepID=A0A158Q6N9_9BILA